MKTRREFETILIAKAWQDPAFKQRLFENPKKVIEEMSGETLPKDMEIDVIEESPTKVALVVPMDPERELSLKELEQIAGGIKMESEEERLRYLNNIFRRF